MNSKFDLEDGNLVLQGDEKCGKKVRVTAK